MLKYQEKAGYVETEGRFRIKATEMSGWNTEWNLNIWKKTHTIKIKEKLQFFKK